MCHGLLLYKINTGDSVHIHHNNNIFNVNRSLLSYQIPLSTIAILSLFDRLGTLTSREIITFLKINCVVFSTHILIILTDDQKCKSFFKDS